MDSINNETSLSPSLAGIERPAQTAPAEDPHLPSWKELTAGLEYDDGGWYDALYERAFGPVDAQLDLDICPLCWAERRVRVTDCYAHEFGSCVGHWHGDPPVLAPCDRSCMGYEDGDYGGYTYDELDNRLRVWGSDLRHDWVVPDLLERGDRLILTGSEGAGKSTLGRQIAVQAASGIHPFDAEARMAPVRVVLVDLENSRAQTSRGLAELRRTAGVRYGRHLWVFNHSADQLDRVDEILDHIKPDLLVIGPLYKMITGDATSEEVARSLADRMDGWRRDYRLAIALEAHSGHDQIYPYGASMWKRWPEFGIHLGKDGILRHWRGMREERNFPVKLSRGGEWPWTAPSASTLWKRILEASEGTASRPSVRDLEKALGVPKSAVHRAIKAHEKEWNTLRFDGE